MLKKISADTTANRFCALVTGPSGIGKTSLLRTICGQEFITGEWQTVSEPEKVCVISAESGLLCVRDLVQQGLIEGCEVSSIADFIEAQRLMLSPAMTTRGYKWLFIDSLSEIASLCAADLEVKYQNSRNGFQMWGDYNRQMTAIIKAFRDMTQYNVVFTVLESVDKDEMNRRFLAPDIAGSQLKSRLVSYFDEAFHLELNEQGERVVATQAPLGITKDRSGKLSPIEIPNLISIRNKILGN